MLADRYDKRNAAAGRQPGVTGFASLMRHPRRHRRGAAVARLRLRRAARRGHRDRDPGAPGVRLRAGRSSLLPNALSLSAATFNSARIVGPPSPASAIARSASARSSWSAPRSAPRAADRAVPDAPGRTVPRGIAATRGARGGQHHGRPTLRLEPGGPAAADCADARGRPGRLQLPGHSGAAGQDRVPRRCGLVRAAHHGARGGRAGRGAGRQRAAGPGRRCTWSSALGWRSRWRRR